MASYRTALAWGTATTAAGALLAPVLAPGLIGMFKAKGLVPDAIYKLPLSTTHVTTGGIVGVGATRGSVVWSTIGKIALAWVTTLPTAIAFGAVLELVISRI